MKRGVVLGKFMPLHLGHEHLIHTAIAQTDHLTVVVCSLSTEPIDGELRYQWMKNRYAEEMASGHVRVVHLKEDWMPQVPEDCHSREVFYGTWAGTLKALSGGPIDVIFTSEEYGYPVARYLECQHVLVDLARQTVPVSGTAIRKNPIAHWASMNPDVRRYFAKKILLIGPESTGKSTLTHLLGEHYRERGYDAEAIQEYARAWIDEQLDGDMDRLCFEHITLFGQKQLELVEAAQMEDRRQLIFSDTDAMTSLVFQQIYYGQTDPQLLALADAEQWDLILYLQPDVPWVDDGQRNLGERREEVNAMFRQELEKRGMEFVEVKGDWQERLRVAVEAVDQLLDG